MEVIKAAVMGIAAAMLALYMKSVRPEYSSMISISAGIFIFGFALICLQKITGSIQTLGEYLAVSPVYIRILLRITGIAYICDFASCICKDAGYQGHLIMTDEWFDEYMFRLVVETKYVPAKIMELLKQKPVRLPAWDPMFAND